MLVIMDIDKLALDQVVRDVRRACSHGTDKACVCKFYVADHIQEQFSVPYEHATDLASALWANVPVEDPPTVVPLCRRCLQPALPGENCPRTNEGDHERFI